MINSDTWATIFGLGSAAAWGAGDFSGGYAARKGNLLGVILISQFVGGLCLLVTALLFSEAVPPVRHILYGILAGIFGNLGLLALYRGLAQGRMGIVAPLSAVLTALVPIGFSVFTEGPPSVTRWVGFGCFIIAVWLLSSAEIGFRMTVNELVLSIAAGLGFGLFFIFIDQANDISVFWPLVGARIASVSLMTVLVLIAGKQVRPAEGQWLFILITGILDAAGNALFSLAAHFGRLDVSAVLGSLYPAATVMLAWFFLRERLQRWQWLGVAAAFAALILVSA